MTQQEFFNRYRFNVRTDKLGGGSFGTVYKAYDTVLDREVAVKVSEVKVIGGKEFSLMDEFRAIENLAQHPNIANYEKVFTFDMPQGVYDYAVIQYYPHGNLKDLISERKLTEEEKISIARQLLTGLAFLHQNRVVHRDLKPSNILIHIRNRDNGEEIIPKIADFGLSKIAEGGNSRFDNSFGGGTLEYSSPEQLMGRELRFNTDLWAYSVIVYELFTGRPLFAPQTQSTGSVQREKEIYDQILHGEITQKLEALPEKWKKDMLACLVKEPKNRVKSASELSIITDDGKEIVVPQQDVSTIYEGNTVINQSYEGQTVIATEEKAVLQPNPEPEKPIAKPSTPESRKKNKSIGLAIGGGVIALAVAGWFFTQKPSVTEEQPVPVKPDYVFYLKQGDSLAAAKNVEGAKMAYNRALAIKEGDSLILGKLQSLKFVSKDSLSSGKEAEVKTADKDIKPLKRIIEKELKKTYNEVVDIEDGFFLVSNDGKKYGYINPDGKLITELKYDYIQYCFYRNGLLIFSYNNKIGFIDRNGKVIIPPKYDDSVGFFDNLAIVELNEKEGVIDKNGKLVVPLKYDHILGFSEGLSPAAINDKWGYINKQGVETIALQFNHTWFFSEGYAEISTGGKMGYINKKGEIVLPAIYDDANEFKNGIAVVHLDGKYIYIDKEGKYVKDLE